MRERRPTLVCQACGSILRELTPAEAQEVARRPYDFIVYCHEHKNLAREEGY